MQATSPELQLATASAIGHICWGDSRPVKFLVKGNGIMALCRLIRPSADPRVVTAAAWALRAATATPEMALDLIAAEQVRGCRETRKHTCCLLVFGKCRHKLPPNSGGSFPCSSWL